MESRNIARNFVLRRDQHMEKFKRRINISEYVGANMHAQSFLLSTISLLS